MITPAVAARLLIFILTILWVFKVRSSVSRVIDAVTQPELQRNLKVKRLASAFLASNDGSVPGWKIYLAADSAFGCSSDSTCLATASLD